MTHDPTPPPHDSPDTPAPGAPGVELPPFEPDRELIGYLERAQKGSVDQR